MSEKVILILVDGMRPDGMMQCGNPFAQKMVENSTHIKLNDEERAGFIKKENKKMKIII